MAQLRVSIRSDLQTGALDIPRSGPTAPAAVHVALATVTAGLPRAGFMEAAKTRGGAGPAREPRQRRRPREPAPVEPQ